MIGDILKHIRRVARYAAVCALICAFVLCALAGCGVVPPDLSESATEASALRTAEKPQITNPPPSDVPLPEPSEIIKEEKALFALADINPVYEEYGAITIEGMKPEDYDKAMSTQWNPLSTPGEPENMSVDLSKLMNYSDIEAYILNLNKYEGVEVFVIGQSEQGRNIYMVKLDFGKASESDKPLIMLTGGVHAREFAGPEYLIKLLNDTVKKAQRDKYTKLLLESAVIVAVPLVNPDGRGLIIEGGDPDRKSNANGVDLNRAMPSVNAGQLGAGHEPSEDFSEEPGMDFFAGYNLGCESETQAMMKWFNAYVPEASVYIDLHQQGGITFYSKAFISERSDALSREYAMQSNELLKGGYPPKDEGGSYGLSGVGGTFTDYAKSISEGFVYSYGLGRMALDADGDELPLICFHDIDERMEYYRPVNPDFRSICIEIGRTRKYLGAGERARKLREKEFIKYGWQKFLTGTIEIVIGEKRARELRLEAKSG